jgi:pimeloyl-ACP methyl ester carboxylesterase
VHRRLRPVLVTAFCALLATGCTVGPSSRPPLAVYGAPATTTATTSAAPTGIPTGPGGPGRNSEPIRWTDCPADVPTGAGDVTFTVECGTIRVPVSYAGSGQVLTLDVARARGAGVGDDAENLVVLRGSPGQNGRDRVAAVAGNLPEAIRSKYAVITMDLRGTGDSPAAECLSRSSVRQVVARDADPSAGSAADILQNLARQLTFDCTDNVGQDLSSYNTTAAADDLDTLRAALGTDTLDVLGQGAGATLGAVYADRYPGRVGRMVLDSPTDPLAAPDEAAKSRAAALDTALDTFVRSCADFPTGCPLGDDPRTKIDNMLVVLGDGQVADNGLLITGGSVLLLLSDRLGDSASWPDLAQALNAAAGGNVDPVAEMIAERWGVTESRNLIDGLVVYGCNDTTQRLPPAEAASRAAAMPADDLFGRYLVGQVSVCSAWPAPDQALGTRISGTGARPILVLGAVDDPVTPYDGARSVAGQLASARLVSWQSGDHGAYPGGACMNNAVDAYLTEGSLPPTGTLCPP